MKYFTVAFIGDNLIIRRGSRIAGFVRGSRVFFVGHRIFDQDLTCDSILSAAGNFLRII